MTCPGLACRAPTPAELGACLRAVATSARRAAGQAGHRLATGGTSSAQLARFTVAGTLATTVQVLLFMALAPTGALVAQLVSWGASTALANELHRRRTFSAGARVGPLAAQLEGGGLALVGLLVTSSALAGLGAAVPDAGVGLQLLLVLGVTTAVGALRFLALRWSFLIRRSQPA